MPKGQAKTIAGWSSRYLRCNTLKSLTRLTDGGGKRGRPEQRKPLAGGWDPTDGPIGQAAPPRANRGEKESKESLLKETAPSELGESKQPACFRAADAGSYRRGVRGERRRRPEWKHGKYKCKTALRHDQTPLHVAQGWRDLRCRHHRLRSKKFRLKEKEGKKTKVTCSTRHGRDWAKGGTRPGSGKTPKARKLDGFKKSRLHATTHLRRREGDGGQCGEKTEF